MSRTPAGPRRGLPPVAAGISVPADKRFRRSDVRPGRRRDWRRWLRRASWFGGGALVVVLLAAWLGSAFLDASVLRVRGFVLRGNTLVSRSDVDASLQGLIGESVLRVDLEQYRQRLLGNPWIRTAELWRVLPSTVEVRITERTPLAAARLDGQLYLVAADGVIIGRYGPQYRRFDLPIVDGLLTMTPAGPVADAARARLVERFIREVGTQPGWLNRISQLNVANPRNAVVLVEGEPAEIRLGDEKFLERLQRWSEMAPRTREQQAVSEYWEMRFDDHLVYVK
jgi:cell division septal protein FtsQ